MRSFDPGHRNKLPPPWKTSTIRRFLGSLLFYFTPVFYLRFLRFPFKHFSTFINNNITLNNLNNRTNLNSFKCLGKNHLIVISFIQHTRQFEFQKFGNFKNLPPSIKNPRKYSFLEPLAYRKKIREMERTTPERAGWKKYWRAPVMGSNPLP